MAALRTVPDFVGQAGSIITYIHSTTVLQYYIEPQKQPTNCPHGATIMPNERTEPTTNAKEEARGTK